jgi:SAM-dependent methyltransferase
MSFESLMRELQALNSSVEALAAIGAELRLRGEGLSAEPRVRSLLQGLVHKIDPGLFEGLKPSQELAAIALIQTSFRQAFDLLENPARPPGWTYEDPAILESQGQVSRLIVRSIEIIAAQLPDLDSTLRQPGTFLDIGTGVGWLAVETARTWSALRVVGIDFWEPALNLARRNVAQTDFAERVELRLQRIEQLDDHATFTLAWLPGPFIAEEIMDVALKRVYQALAPGGWLIVGLHPPPPNALDQVLTDLRVVRGGGHPWTANQIKERLQAVGLEGIETISPSPPVLFVLGRRQIVAK